jgi:ABC-type nitrate/sulfonate/bicarbonate transport system substrate-binding protein
MGAEPVLPWGLVSRGRRGLPGALLLVLLVTWLGGAACGPRAEPAAPAAERAPATGASAAAPAAAATEAPEEDVTFAFPSPSISWLALLVAERQGFFAEERLTPSFVQMTPANNAVAVLSGDIDFALGLTTIAQIAVQQGAPLRSLLALAVRPQHRLMVRPEIQSFADLRGKVVAFNQHLDITEWETRIILQRNGVALDDVNVQAIPSSPSRLAGLDSGQLAAAIMAAPFDLQSEAQGHHELGRISRDVEIAWMGLSTATRTITERPELVQRTLRATLRGIAYTRTQRDETLRLMQEALDMTPAVATASYALGLETWSEDGTASDEAWRNTLEISRMAGPLPDDVPLDQYVDLAPVDAARRTLSAPR